MESSRTQPPGLALSAKAQRTPESPISELMAAAIANPAMVNLAAGFVDDRTLPVDECAAIARRIFSDPGRGQAALQYDTTLGLRPLRQQLLSHLERLEGRSSAELGFGIEDILVTTGSQQALYLVGDVLVDPGDIVIAANPSYFVFTGTLQSLGARVLGVPADDQGLDVDAVGWLLERLAAEGRLPRVRFIYITSYCDNPTGLTLGADRRRRLVELVRRYSREHRILILEDAAYRELRYDGESPPSIKSFDRGNEHVILSQTFSKPFAPGLKLGYTVMPRGLMGPVLRQKGNHDFGSANLCQQIALEAMRDGSYDRHVALLRVEYRRKRDAMLAALDRHLGHCPGIHWTRPHGGMYIWLTLPEWLDTSRRGTIFSACVERGVLYVPGDLSFHPDDSGQIPRNHVRLSFGQVALEQIEPGIQRLAAVVREQVARGGAA